MNDGFFPAASLPVLEQDYTTLQTECGKCRLNLGCNSPKMPVSGKGKKGIYILAEAPGADEDRHGIQLVGNSGRKLMDILRPLGIDMRNDCWLDNSLICRPPDNKIPKPAGKYIDYCRPHVIKNVQELKPTVIIPLGAVAADSLLGWLWKEDVGGINRWAGYRIPHQKLNAWVCPTFHPAALLYEKGGLGRLMERMFVDHLRAAVSLKGRPWKEVPNYEEKIDVCIDANRAAKIVREMNRRGGTVAFDYETTMLKPDSKDAEIVCCSVCWEGKKTVAFPWHGEAVHAVRELLVNADVNKVGWNSKFEHRWTEAKLGVRVKGWKWCGMLASHVMENAGRNKKITSIKFQAFVKLGVPIYNTHVEAFLESRIKGRGNVRNRIKEIDTHTLLLYCGLDSLLEFLVADIQMKEFFR